MNRPSWIAALLVTLPALVALAADPGEAPKLGARITQNSVENELSLKQIRREGRRIFSTPFNTADGLGSPGRPQLFGPFSRVLRLPIAVNAEKVEATLRDGVLSTTLLFLVSAGS